MGKNAHLHIVLDSDFLQFLKKQAENRGISVSELCRIKLKDNLQLDKIQYLIEMLIKDGKK
jgi:hypothetical protein